MFFQTKFQKKYRDEFKKEARIQTLINKNNWDRIYATHHYDFEQEMKFQNKGSKFFIKNNIKY